ncbi:MAG TPA: hypothetical protein DCS19_05615 [Flavobacterium sp.]|nr:hypothetical protein [Flavobacterium sp.]
MTIMKKYPGMGPMQIRDYIHKHEGISYGVNTVRNIMIDSGWMPPVNRKRELLPETFRRYEAVRRNALWHADFLHHYINNCKVYVIFIQDDYSRFIVSFGIFDSESTEAVIDTLEKALALHGKPDSFMSDKGSAFWSWKGISVFSQNLEDYGIDQLICSRPQSNGKIENLNQQFAKECLSHEKWSSLNMFENAVKDWISFYNFKRCHQGLHKLETPADRFYPGHRECCHEFSNHKDSDSSQIKAILELLIHKL